MVNWTWYPSGGDWTYIENLSFVYKSNGHQIIPFSMQHNENFESEYSKFFIKKIDYKSLHQKNKFVAGLDVISRGIYSFEAVNKLKALLKHVKIELAHINIIHRYITPSILKVLKDNGIPIVWTLHDMNPFQGIFHYKNDVLDNKNSIGQLDAQIEKFKLNILSF